MRLRWLLVSGATFPVGSGATPATTDMLSPMPMTLAAPAPGVVVPGCTAGLCAQFCVRATQLSKLLQYIGQFQVYLTQPNAIEPQEKR